MPFWLHTSKAMLMLGRFSLRQKLIACIVLIAFALFIGWYGFCVPLRYKHQRIKHNLEALQQQEVLFHQKAHHAHQVTQLHARFGEQIKELIAKSYTPQKTMAHLLELMQKHKISCRGIKPQAVAPKNFYEKHYVSVGGRGTFGNILAFLRDMQDCNVATKCKTLSIRKDSYRDLKFTLLVRVISVKDV